MDARRSSLRNFTQNYTRSTHTNTSGIRNVVKTWHKEKKSTPQRPAARGMDSELSQSHALMVRFIWETKDITLI